jgi:signal transduction histidine kinase
VVTFDTLIEVLRQAPVPLLADWTVVHVLNDDTSLRVIAGPFPDEPHQTLPTRTPLPVGAADPLSVLGQVIATGRLAVADLTEGPAANLFGQAAPGTALNGLPVRSAAMLPLVAGGRVKGVLSLLCAAAHRFSSAETLVLEELTRRIEHALERIQLYREAEEANRLKDEFLGTLSHELRTPLNAIFGWARILRARRLDERTAHGVEVIQRNAEVQLRLIDEVLDVSRIIRGKMMLEIEPIDLAALLRATIETVRPALHAKRLRLDVHIGDTPPILGDRHRLQQAFWNLLSNALKFTGVEGSIAITLRGSGDSVEFEITDTGVGIRRDVLPFVFDRFRQADSSTTRTYGGLGLGLAIVKHIVELHGGTVRAASAGEGHGATFTIRLPAEARLGRAAILESPAAAPSSSPVLHTRTVLVVEDHDDARELIVGILEGAGARVLAAAAAGEALALAAEVRPDVLVSDIGVPGEDGYTLLAKLRTMFPGIPALALTAYARAADRDRALAAGFQHHVVKPVDPQHLLQLIASVLE